jgi:RNA-directed DNA polymerase
MIRQMYDAAYRAALADELADAFLASRWQMVELAESGSGRLDRWPAWMDALALHVVAVDLTAPIGRRRELARLIATFLSEQSATPGESERPRIVRLMGSHDVLGEARQTSPCRDWPIAAVESVGALAERLELSPGQLAWLADVRGLERTVSQERLRNYRYRAVPRRNGLPRVIEAPKARLKEIQRWLLHEILDHIPAHEAAHGFTRGRSVVSHARLHTQQAVVLRLDLKDFFASIAAGRVYGIFRTVGYSPPVAHVLTGLATNTVPHAILEHVSALGEPHLVQQRFWLGRQLATPHLPQGAPSSPALANLVAFRLDRRLDGLARRSGLHYSRYADDLTLSGPHRLRRQRDTLERLIADIAREEGFRVNQDKSALRTDAGRQLVCGVVVNLRPNVVRVEYDRLKAILHNAAHQGPQTQTNAELADFKSHLLGRIAWVAAVNPDRGARLRKRFAEIEWSRPGDAPP